MKKYWRLLKDLSIHFSRDFGNYFYKGWQASLTTSYLKSFAKSLLFHLNQCRINLHSKGIQNHHIEEERMKKLQITSLGLYQLLPKDVRFSYSALMFVNHPSPKLFQESIQSVFNQSNTSVELIIGSKTPLCEKLLCVVQSMQQQYPSRIKLLMPSEGINQLAAHASGKYLFVLGEEDWIRPDFLFRCEQTLRLVPQPEKTVLYCNHNKINDKGYFIPESEFRHLGSLCFPFFFQFFHEEGLLIPSSLWRQAGGLHYSGAAYEHLLLQLDLRGACFQHIPITLYSIRDKTRAKKEKSESDFIQALQEYAVSKKLNWDYFPGLLNHTVRAIPPLPSGTVQVIIPYKDQKELTLQCVESVLKQKNVSCIITAIDNRSTDLSIAEEIRRLGGEVISIDEPFNYSRLNNLAVQRTCLAKTCETLLFLNNDVILEEDAVQEMFRWINQKGVGLVGCRLHYPDGTLQHGGVKINFHGTGGIRWEHIEKLYPLEEMRISKTLHLCEAVTAACSMMKKELFLEIGGFDEIWYPIGYSDTNLSVKVAAKGLSCLYTPYAAGIHYESVSRKSAIEDYENSWWLHHLLIENKKVVGSPLKYYPK